MEFLCKLFAGSYENIWKAIIRPSRDNYSIKDLGPYKFELNSKNYKRTDLIVPNKRQQKLKCSFWEPFDEEREYEQLPCVIYLHGNSSSRLEALGQIKHLLPLNITVFAFDFSGCGKSEGQYISLGYYESDDVESVVNYLLKTNKVSTIGLWGRSMGAVTSILYASRENNHLSAILLDSAFYSLKILIEELIEKNINMPKFILNSMIDTLRKTIIEKANFDILEIEPFLFAKNCSAPAYFCHAKEDTLINVHHCNDLYNVYPGDKNIVLLKGNHNTPRNNDFKNSGAIFFYHYLNLNDLKINSGIDNSFFFNNINNNNTLLNFNKSYKCKTKIDLDNYSNDNYLKDNVNEKNENEKGKLHNSTLTIMSYFQKCSCNDLNKINNDNKKMISSLEIEKILHNTKNISVKNLKGKNEIKMKSMDFNKNQRIKISNSLKNVYCKKNIHNPFTKSMTKIKPLPSNCTILNDMELINHNIIHNSRYKNIDNFNINKVNNYNFDDNKDNKNIFNDYRSHSIYNNDNFYKKNIRTKIVSKSNNLNNNKNPFLFRFSNKNESGKLQKLLYRDRISNTVDINRKNFINKNDKKWVIFEGINPYLKENKDYFKKKVFKKDNSFDEDNNTINNDNDD